jgi:mannose-1-phosphate guanylyltransferase
VVNHFFAVIMAGGGGTRLWPLSRRARPKQMLRLIDERSLFQISVERVGELFPCDRIYVVTVEDQAAELKDHCPDIPSENYLIEPMPRGTASVVGLAAVALKQRDPDAVMAILTSDHFIGNEPGFRDILKAAYDVAQDGYLVTLGIAPTYPAVGYGYIQQGEWIRKYRGFDAFQVGQFKEKPAESQARGMLAAGGHAWNSGMFVWRVDRILEEFARQMPGLYASLQEISAHWDAPERRATVERIWPVLKEETIDYGIMESAEKVAVIPASELQWSDVGSWDSLFDVLPGDQNGNIVMGGQHIGLDTNSSLVYVSEEHRLIVTIGVDDLVVVDTGDVLLVCRKDQAQRVRQIVATLKKSGDEYV